MASTVIDTFVSLVLISRENDVPTFSRNERTDGVKINNSAADYEHNH